MTDEPDDPVSLEQTPQQTGQVMTDHVARRIARAQAEAGMSTSERFLSRVRTNDYRADEMEMREMRARRTDITFESELAALRQMINGNMDEVLNWSGWKKNKLMRERLAEAYDSIMQERMMLDMELEAKGNVAPMEEEP